MRTLDIDLLRTFHTIARLGRFKDAAAYLGKSTSAVSVHVQRLEEVAQARLFERDNQGVVLSVRGRELLKETAALLAEHDRIVAALRSAPVTGKIRLGIPEEYAGTFIKQGLPLFAMEHSGIELHVEAASSASLLAMFERERLDTVISVEEKPTDDGIILTQIQPVWAVGRDLQALSQEPLPVALHGDGCPYRELALSSLKQSGRAWRTVVASENSAAIMAAMESGLAIAAAADARLPDTLSMVPPSYGLPSIPTCTVMYRAHQEREADTCLRKALVRYFDAPGF